MSAGGGGFSPSLTLAGMDYIAPSAACIKPTLMRDAAAAAGDAAGGRGLVGAKRGGNATAAAASAASGGYADVVKITLQDCLACSGCVTTAETVLVNAQSRFEVVLTLLGRQSGGGDVTVGTDGAAVPARPRLVSISPQSCASLAAYLRLSMDETYALIAGFMRHVLTPSVLLQQAEAAAAAEAGANAQSSPAVLKLSEGTESVAPAQQEADRSSSPSPTEAPATAADAPPVVVIDLEWAEQLSAALTAQEYSRRRAEAVDTLPMIVSACPGWVCYCEKQGSALLPHLCPVMSAQGIAGSYAKRLVSPAFYHVSIQPCFDRKLEAARDSMPADTAALPVAATEGEAEPAVFYTDCVLSTAELLEWMREVDATLPWRGPLDSRSDRQSPLLVTKATSAEEENAASAHSDASPSASPAVSDAAREAARLAGSGSYHQSVMAARLREVAAAAPSVQYEVKRNRNHQLATCPQLPGEVFCLGYGFQQIQNVVRGLKKKMPAMRGYTFVELMACPDGCLSGGGQVRPAQQAHSDVLEAVLNSYAQHSTTAAACAAGVGRAVDAGDVNEEQEMEKAQQRRRVEAAEGSDVPVPLSHFFTDSAVAALAPRLGDRLWRCAFRDREKEFAEMLNAGNIHSLKW